MKMNDEAVLEPLHLEPADLSSGRGFVREATNKPSEADVVNLTRMVLEFRVIFSRSTTYAPTQTAEQPIDAQQTHHRCLEEISRQHSVV